MSKWKAGQCITIEGKQYKVTKLNARAYCSCIFCEFKLKECNEYPCTGCLDDVPSLIPRNCYLKEIKPKS